MKGLVSLSVLTLEFKPQIQGENLEAGKTNRSENGRGGKGIKEETDFINRKKIRGVTSTCLSTGQSFQSH